MPENKRQDWQGEGKAPLDARQKFEKAQKDLKQLQRRLFDSRNKEAKEQKDLAEVAERRKRLMAREYLDRSKKRADAVKKAGEDLQKANAKLADTVAISEELSSMLKEKKAQLKQLELEYLKEGEKISQEKSEAVSKEYREKYQELLELRKKATDVKREIQGFQNRQRVLEREIMEAGK